MRTRHGVVPLGAFFSEEARIAQDEKKTREAVVEVLAEKFRVRPELKSLGWKDLKPLLSEWGLEMAKRTWRNYKSEILARWDC